MESKKEKKGIKRLLSKNKIILIEACDGTKTIASSQEVFDICIDHNFYDPDMLQPGEATKSVQVNVFEVVKDSTLMQIFASFGDYQIPDFDMDELCLTQHQISCFCEKHKNWLRSNTCGTLFLTKVGFNYFVSHVISFSGNLAVHRHRLSDSVIKWKGISLHRVVTHKKTKNKG